MTEHEHNHPEIPPAQAAPETVFTPDRQAYIRHHAWMAAAAMAAAMLVLWLLEDPNIWTGAVAGLAGLGLRGWYQASEALKENWTLRDGGLSGPGGRQIALSRIKAVNSLGSFVQIITDAGDKHLIKYQPDPAATKAAIERAQGLARATDPQ